MIECYPVMKMIELLIHTRNIGESHKPCIEKKQTDTKDCIL